MQKEEKKAKSVAPGETMPESPKKHVLVAILGTSPAVLTEAVWALVMEKGIVPDQIEVLTTSKGRDEFVKNVKGKIWDRLKSDLAAKGKQVDRLQVGDASFHIFPDENQEFAKDLVSYDANMRAADMMVDVLRKWTKGNEYIVHGLIAGGRKTMTALFFSCMSLMARRDDKVYHVLASAGCEKDPDFFYPRDGSDAEVNLFSVPFVRVGRWAEELLKGKSMTYQNLIDAVEQDMDTAYSSLKRRNGAGGRSSLPDGDVTTKYRIEDEGRAICVKEDPHKYRITRKQSWELLDKLLKAAASKNGDGWIECTSGEIHKFNSTDDAKKFRGKYIKTDKAPQSKKICKARLNDKMFYSN